MLTEFLASTALLAGPTPGEAASVPQPPGVATRRVVVTYKRGQGPETVQAVRQRDGVVGRSFSNIRVLAAQLPADEIARLERDPAVASVEPDRLRFAAGLADEELEPSPLNGLYGLLTTRAFAVQSQVPVAGNTVCVADTGVDGTHPDIAPSYDGGIDVIDNDLDPSAPPGGDEDHGTHVAGTIVGALNGYGVRGVAPGVRLVHARVLGPGGSGQMTGIMEGVRRLVEERGCTIVNMSLTGPSSSVAEARFYADLAARGVLVVAATGNDSAQKVGFPAAYDSVLAVGAVDRSNTHADFSNSGDKIDVSGPGVDVLSAVPRGTGRTGTIAVPGAAPVEGTVIGNSGLSEGVTGPVVNAGDATDATVLKRPEVRGGVVVIFHKPGATPGLSDFFLAALDAGAVAAVIVSSDADPIGGSLRTPVARLGQPWFPIVSLTALQGEALRTAQTVTVTNRTTDWAYFDGTSMASPHVAGVAALVRAARPTLTPADIERILETTATDLGPPGFDPVYGEGMVDAERAVAAARAGT